MENNYQIISKIKVLPIDTVISHWVSFNKKTSMIYCYTNSKSSKAIYLFLRNSKVEDFLKNKSLFFSFLVFVNLFQLSVGYVTI